MRPISISVTDYLAELTEIETAASMRKVFGKDLGIRLVLLKKCKAENSFKDIDELLS